MLCEGRKLCLIFNPLTQILTKANLNVGFPRLVGVCGRAGVLEGEMTPLASVLDESFNVRASFAAQILTMVDDFMVSCAAGRKHLIGAKNINDSYVIVKKQKGRKNECKKECCRQRTWLICNV